MKPLVVILCPYPKNSVGSQRFRFEQYLPYLKEQFSIVQLPFWSEKTNQILYKKGLLIQKSTGLIASCIKRILQLPKIYQAQIVFIHRETFPVGGAFYEYIISKWLKKKIIFDFDDAIWNLDSSDENKSMAWMKKPQKTENIIRYADLIFAGNQYLANYASQYNSNIIIIPTTIDTYYHQKQIKESNSTICIGWTGSKTTIPHFEIIIPVLLDLKQKYNDQISFQIIGDRYFQNDIIGIQGIEWNINSEIEDLSHINIGLMPLPDDEWTKGKCGFKGLQYMALSIPTIMSPVGVNNEIIENGKNGFLANSHKEWVEKISALIDSEELRNKIGKEGRETILKKFSVNSNKEKYLLGFKSLIS